MRAVAIPLLVLAACATATHAQAQSANQTTGLAFGRFAANGGGTVKVTSNGARSRTGAVVLLPSTSTAASFNVAATGNKQIIVTLPPNGSTALVNGNASMAVNGFESNRPNGVLTNPKQPLAIGATLQVGANQRGGNYSGTFSIILEYQ